MFFVVALQPLCFAAELGNVQLVKLLIEAGSDLTRACAEGTAADIAYNQGHSLVSDSGEKFTYIKSGTDVLHE